MSDTILRSTSHQKIVQGKSQTMHIDAEYSARLYETDGYREYAQYIIARHIDREHPHCHIVFNRVDNDGKTISDKNDFRRNEKSLRKMLTAKYCLHFANGKDYIKEERLRPYDKAKHEIYKALKEELPTAHSWDNLKDALADREIGYEIQSQPDYTGNTRCQV